MAKKLVKKQTGGSMAAISKVFAAPLSKFSGSKSSTGNTKKAKVNPSTNKKPKEVVMGVTIPDYKLGPALKKKGGAVKSKKK